MAVGRNRAEVEIAAKPTGFDAAFNKITSQARQANQQIKNAFSGMQGAAAALGASLSAAGFVLFVKGAIDAADKLNDLSKVTGLGAKTIGGIGFAAQQAGSDLEGVAKSFGKLNLFIADALAGNSAALEAFSKVGLGIAELRNQKPEEIFAKLADAFSKFEDGANKAAGAETFFGKSYTSVLPLLDEGGKSLRKNIEYFERYSGVTDDLIRASDQFNDSLTKLNLLNRAFANNIASALLPSLQGLVDYLVQTKEETNGFGRAATAVIEPLKVLAKWGVTVAMTFAQVGDFIGATAAALGAVTSGELGRALTVYDDYFARAKDTEQRLERLKSAIDGAGTIGSAVDAGAGGGTRRRRPAPNFGNAGAGAAKSGADEFARALERVAKMAAEADLELAGMFSTQEITSARKALAGLTSSDEWKKFTGSQQAELTARYQAIDAIQRETLEWKKKNEEQEKSIKLLQEIQQEQQQEVRAFTSNLGQYADDNDILAREIGLIGQEDSARQKLAATIEFERLKRQALLADDDPAAAAARIALLEAEFQKRIQLIDELANATRKFQEIQAYNQIFADSFATAVSDVVSGTKSISDAFKDMAKSIADAITRIAAQKLAESIFGGKDGIGNIFASLFGTGSTGGGAGFDFSQIFSWLFGSGGGVPAFAGGGNPPVGRISLVGERGPELIYPRSAMTVVPINGSVGGGGSDRVAVNQTINVLPGASYQTARQAAKMAADRATFARRRG